MKTTYKTINELLAAHNDDILKQCPLPLQVIPNHMGINLVSVDGISWQRKEDGQLTSLTIYFLPNE